MIWKIVSKLYWKKLSEVYDAGWGAGVDQMRYDPDSCSHHITHDEDGEPLEF